MKNIILTGGLLAFVFCFGAACTQEKQPSASDTELVKAEIQLIENQFASAFNMRNIDSISYYADDAISYFAGQHPIVGIDAILQHLDDEFAELPEGARISFETLEVYVTNDGKNAAEIGTHTLVDSSGFVLQSGHYFSFFAKRDGRFVCTRDMANSVGFMPVDSLQGALEFE